MFNKNKTEIGKSETEWNPDEGDEEQKEESKSNIKQQKSGFYDMLKKKKSLISISEESENAD